MERGEMIIGGETHRVTLIGRPSIVVEEDERYKLNMNKINIGLGRVEPLQIIGNAELTRSIHQNTGGYIIIEYSDCNFELFGCELSEKSDLDNDIIWIDFDNANVL